jgi:hypothetical protein
MSTVKVDTLVASDGTSPVTLTGQYAAKVWINFNGQNTVAIRGSEGVSSLSDNGTGDYTINFSTAMVDVNYAGGGIAQSYDGSNAGSLQNLSGYALDSAQTTTSLRVSSQYSNGNARDPFRALLTLTR